MQSTAIHPFADILNAAHNVWRYTEANDGGTFTRTGREVGDKIERWAVGGKEPGQVITLAGLTTEQIIQRIAAFIQQTPYTDGGTYIGTWIEDGSLYLDVVDLIPSVFEAIVLASQRKEKAIYNLHTHETYNLGI